MSSIKDGRLLRLSPKVLRERIQIAANAKLKILTFNHHESYLCSLAEVGHDFEVVIRRKSLDLSWHHNQRPCPANVTLIEFDEETKAKLSGGYYDVVICHTLKNLLWLFFFWRQKFIFVAHIPLFTYSPVLRLKSFFKKLIFKIFKLTHDVKFLAVSEFKRQSWGEEGSVAVLSPGHHPEPRAGEGYSQIIVVCNEIVRRSQELGYEELVKLADEFPIKIIGNNPGAKNAVLPKDFADFENEFRSGRIYLYTIVHPFGDGYNTAMLEAMQMGLCIVSVANPSSPIVHGVNGLIGSSSEEIRQHLKRVLSDKELVEKLGAAAKKTIEEKFSKDKFIQAWNDVFAASGPVS